MSDNPMEMPKEGWKPSRSRPDPTTWRSTPAYATDAMIEAGARALHPYMSNRVARNLAEAVINAALLASPKTAAASAWLPIDDAARGGNDVLLCCYGGVYRVVAHWNERPRGWRDNENVFYGPQAFDLWMPIPEPPATGDAAHG